MKATTVCQTALCLATALAALPGAAAGVDPNFPQTWPPEDGYCYDGALGSCCVEQYGEYIQVDRSCFEPLP